MEAFKTQHYYIYYLVWLLWCLNATKYLNAFFEWKIK